jgi:hypothetical protein
MISMEPQNYTGTSSMKRKAPLCNTLQREAHAKINTCYETVSRDVKHVTDGTNN